MTGFGRGEASCEAGRVRVELKSVNNRFRDINLRAPREYLALEPRINALLKDPFARGRIDAYVRRNAGPSGSHVVADAALAAEYAEAIGVDAYMIKPVPLASLVEKAAELVANRKKGE